MTIITAPDGYKYTQAASVELMRRVVAKTVYLSSAENDNAWTLVPDHEADAILAQQRSDAEMRKRENNII